MALNLYCDKRLQRKRYNMKYTGLYRWLLKDFLWLLYFALWFPGISHVDCCVTKLAYGNHTYYIYYYILHTIHTIRVNVRLMSNFRSSLYTYYYMSVFRHFLCFIHSFL